MDSSKRLPRWFRRLLLWGISLAVLFGFGWMMVKLADRVQLPTQNGTLAVAVSASDHILGPDNATITLVEYADYQCPACGTFYPIIKQLMTEPALKDSLRLVYRNFPLTSIHNNAQLSAQVAEAAALQGKFWEMHDKIFENQQKWSDLSDAGARSLFTSYAQALGLDMTRFSNDLDSQVVKDKIAADVAGANAAGVNATPTFFVDGKQMPPPQSYDQFKSYVTNGIR